MEKTKFAGVFVYTTKEGLKTYYIKYSLKGKQFKEKVGTSAEGITAVYASKIRAKKTSVDRLKEDAPMIQNQKHITFDEAFNIYFESIKEKSDAVNIKGRYNNHLKDEIGSFKLDDITVEVVEKFKDKAKLKKKADRKTLYAQKTVNDWINIISTVYNFMISKRDLKIYNPAHGSKVERLVVNNDRERYLEINEIEELFDYLDNRVGSNYKSSVTEDLKVFSALAFSTGARLTSVLSISKRDINLNNDSIHIINHKSNRTYQGYIHPKFKSIIERRYNEIKMIDYMVGSSPKQKHRASISKALQPILNDLFNKDLDLNDRVRRVVIHSFRHTFASQLAIAGVPIYTIMKLMDHADISQTIRYAKLSPDNGRDGVFKIKF